MYDPRPHKPIRGGCVEMDGKMTHCLPVPIDHGYVCGWCGHALPDPFSNQPVSSRVMGPHTDSSITELLRFIHDVATEVFAARKKFPSSYGVMCALTEEVGEVAKAYMDYPLSEVRKEAVQVAAMAARLALEGDPSLQKIRDERHADSGGE